MQAPQPVRTRIGGAVTHAETLTHNSGNAATGGIWRVHGPAGTAILKVARPPSAAPAGSPSWQTSDAPEHWNYWRREVTAYTSGFAAEAYAGTGIEVPEPLATVPRPDGAIELWLAEATGAHGTAWPPARFRHFARQLGAGQARWAGRVPALPWLSRRWLRQYLAHGPATTVTMRTDEDWSHPLTAAWPAAELRRVWEHRETVLRRAEEQPRTLAHLDVWPTNLIADGDRTVLIDWAFTGDGALGEDIANLIIDSVTDNLIDAALLPDIEDAATEGYLEGLRDGGWQGDPDGVRRAIAACGAAKYGWFAPAVLGRMIRGHRIGNAYGRSLADDAAELERLRGLVTMIVRWAAL
ncbi:hypothetical protein [Catenuloplanes atrovinosus]|uniref:Aminoglycoside phosphotransferase n=1 Tax=Catenuloplanes atrovinosus TaxID=137266 RepID=A0AAE3YM32_9ACTN|nr:hypothetical protein [Catenuloplanes atrovinosus]MDR7275012.1 hypothetical protein [Catenuloplanes atrovinosus]